MGEEGLDEIWRRRCGNSCGAGPGVDDGRYLMVCWWLGQKWSAVVIVVLMI